MKLLASIIGLPFLVLLTWWATSAAAPTALAAPLLAPAQGVSFTGSTGAGGAADFTVNQVIDLSDATLPGLQYDPVNWVVNLNYTSFRIRPNVTVSFKNHPSRAPVVIRSLGQVLIEGTLNLDGERGANFSDSRYIAEPGPGGFRGGAGRISSGQTPLLASGGHGPGGGFVDVDNCSNAGGPGSFTTWGADTSCDWGPPGNLYGVPAAASLLGGSGGAGGNNPGSNGSGGSGGGAILIGSDLNITVTGVIRAQGGDYGVGGSGGTYGGAGSGGTIRLASQSIAGNGTLDVRGATPTFTFGGAGRVQIETPNHSAYAFNMLPAGAVRLSMGEFIPINPPRVSLYGWRTVPVVPTEDWHLIGQDPRSEIRDAVQADVPLPSIGLHRLRIQGTGMPQGTAIQVRVTYTRGQALYIDDVLDLGPSLPTDPPGSVFGEVDVDFQLGVSTVQVRAIL